jgi:hypothetical protein
MAKVKVKVLKVSDKTTNGNFIHTLKTEGETIKVLGQDMIGNGLTYYAALKGAAQVGTEELIDLSRFDVVERPYEVEDQESGELRTLMLKWLYPKRPSSN